MAIKISNEKGRADLFEWEFIISVLIIGYGLIIIMPNIMTNNLVDGLRTSWRKQSNQQQQQQRKQLTFLHWSHAYGSF